VPVTKLLIEEWCTYLDFLDSGVIGLKFITFLHDVARLSQKKLLKSELRYSTPLLNAKATNEDESADFANFNPKISTASEWSEKEDKIINLRPIKYLATIR